MELHKDRFDFEKYYKVVDTVDPVKMSGKVKKIDDLLDAAAMRFFVAADVRQEQ